MLHLLLAFVLSVVIHIATIAIAARAVGVKVLLVSLGHGPTLYQGHGYRLGALPVGGYVKCRYTVDDIDPEAGSKTAIDERSTIEQLTIALSGCLALLVLALALKGGVALEAFLRFPAQIFAGAGSPLGEAQSLLRSAAYTLQTSTFIGILALVTGKFAALNLLPLPAYNGGAAVALLAKRAGLGRWWPAAATRALLLIWMGVLGSWFFAVCLYFAET